jgi:hypothetical protein
LGDLSKNFADKPTATAAEEAEEREEKEEREEREEREREEREKREEREEREDVLAIATLKAQAQLLATRFVHKRRRPTN